MTFFVTLTVIISEIKLCNQNIHLKTEMKLTLLEEFVQYERTKILVDLKLCQLLFC